MEFHFLGTGSGLPSKERNVSSLAVRFLQRKRTQWLFDCGEATQHQLLNSPITLAKLDKIFITHLHGDHLFGLPGLLCSRSAQGAKTPLTIYGPKGIEMYVETTLSLSRSHLAYELNFVTVHEGILFSEEEVTVEAILLDHVIPSFAYKLTEADKSGTLNRDRLLAEGVKPGPIYKSLKDGETVTLPDGRTLDGKDYVGAPKKGHIVVIAGDTRPVSSLITFAKGADVLIHEGTFRTDKKTHADEFGHSTIADVAMLAKRANVKKLIITHISSRYAGEEEELKEEAQQIFANSEIASDMMVYKLQS